MQTMRALQNAAREARMAPMAPLRLRMNAMRSSFSPPPRGSVAQATPRAPLGTRGGVRKKWSHQSRRSVGVRIDEVAKLQKESPYWCGNLCEVKSAMLDYIVDERNTGRDTWHLKWEKHKQRVRSDLLLAAIVRMSIISEHGSVESARETYTSNQSSWTEYLRTMASRGHALQALVMAYT